MYVLYENQNKKLKNSISNTQERQIIYHDIKATEEMCKIA